MISGLWVGVYERQHAMIHEEIDQRTCKYTDEVHSFAYRVVIRLNRQQLSSIRSGRYAR